MNDLRCHIMLKGHDCIDLLKNWSRDQKSIIIMMDTYHDDLVVPMDPQSLRFMNRHNVTEALKSLLKNYVKERFPNGNNLLTYYILIFWYDSILIVHASDEFWQIAFGSFSTIHGLEQRAYVIANHVQTLVNKPSETNHKQARKLRICFLDKKTKSRIKILLDWNYHFFSLSQIAE